MSSHYLNITECSSGPLGPLIRPAVSGMQWILWESYESEIHLCWALVLQLIDYYSFVHYVLMYPVMYCGVRSAGRVTLMLIKCVYPCWLLIGAGVVSRCWRLLLCVAVPRLPLDTLFPVTWGLSLAGEPVEAALGEEMTRWFEIAANPMPALLPD